MATRNGNFDPEIANLDGGLFGYSPRQELPLASFGLHGKVIEPVDAATSAGYRRARLDSLAPMAFMPAMEGDAPKASRPSPWLSGAVVGFSAAVLAATAIFPSLGLLHGRGGARSAAMAQVAEPVAAPAPVPAAVSAPTTTTAAAPVIVPAPAKIATKNAPAPRAMVAARAAAPAAAPLSTADLPELAPTPMPEIPPAPRAPEIPFARAAAAVAIASAGMSAGSCRDPGAGPLAVSVSVTFAPSGHASGATVDGGPMAGTSEASCLSWALRGAKVPAFDGEPVVVRTTVHLR